MEYKKYLKEKYLSEIRQKKSVSNIIAIFQKKMDIFEIEPVGGEKLFLDITRKNYIAKLGDISKLNFVTYELEKNDKSKQYYEKSNLITGKIVIIVESQLNAITSNSEELKIDLLIERGIDNYDVENDTTEFLNYLMFFNTRDTDTND